MAPKVLVTRLLPPQTQARLIEQDFELIQWQEDSTIPRDILLEKVKGKSHTQLDQETLMNVRRGCFILFTNREN